MIIYEVNLQVEPGAASAFADWLPGHVGEMLSLPGFIEADLLEVLEEAGDGHRRWSVRYALEDEAALERYFAEFAAGMRAEGEVRFGGRFTASRRVLRPLQRFEARAPAPETAER